MLIRYLKLDNLGLRKDYWEIFYKITFLIVILRIPSLSASRASTILKIKKNESIVTKRKE